MLQLVDREGLDGLNGIAGSRKGFIKEEPGAPQGPPMVATLRDRRDSVQTSSRHPAEAGAPHGETQVRLNFAWGPWAKFDAPLRPMRAPQYPWAVRSFFMCPCSFRIDNH